MFDEDAGKPDDIRTAPTPTDGHHDHLHRQQRQTSAPVSRMACRLHVRAEPVAARNAEHAHALPRARTHPLDGRQQRPPVEHPELCALGQLLGNRGGVPARSFVTESVSPSANNPCGPCRVRAHFPREARHPARTPRVRGPLGAPSAVAVGEPAGDLRAGGPRDGRSRPGRRRAPSHTSSRSTPTASTSSAASEGSRFSRRFLSSGSRPSPGVRWWPRCSYCF